MATDTESVLEFVIRHYEDLKTKAETDNNTQKNDKINRKQINLKLN